jgi:hypothetical protein
MSCPAEGVGVRAYADRAAGRRSAHVRLGGDPPPDREPAGRGFTATLAAPPGEQVQIDSTPIDVMVLAADGVPVRADLTIAVDVATRTICAAVLRPAGTKAVDAALLLAGCWSRSRCGRAGRPRCGCRRPGCRSSGRRPENRRCG